MVYNEVVALQATLAAVFQPTFDSLFSLNQKPAADLGVLRTQSSTLATLRCSGSAHAGKAGAFRLERVTMLTGVLCSC